MNLAIPGGWIISIPINLFGLWFTDNLGVVLFIVSMIFSTVLLAAIYIIVWILLKRTEPEEWKHFDFPSDEANRRLDALLTSKGIKHTMASINEQWFGKARKRLGINRNFLDFKDIHSTVYELYDSNRRIMVSDIPSDGKRKTAISFWPMTGDHIQFFESLKTDIDVELATGPS